MGAVQADGIETCTGVMLCPWGMTVTATLAMVVWVLHDIAGGIWVGEWDEWICHVLWWWDTEKHSDTTFQHKYRFYSHDANYKQSRYPPPHESHQMPHAPPIINIHLHLRPPNPTRRRQRLRRRAGLRRIKHHRPARHAHKLLLEERGQRAGWIAYGVVDTAYLREPLVEGD